MTDIRSEFEDWAVADHRDTAPEEYEERVPDNGLFYQADSTNQAYIGWRAGVARDMGNPWGWILGTARWEGSGFVSGWVARGVGGPADGLGLSAPTHWAEFTPPSPTTTQGANP